MERDINSSLAMFELFLLRFAWALWDYISSLAHSRFVVAVALTGTHFASVYKSCCSHLGSIYAVKTHAINN